LRSDLVLPANLQLAPRALPVHTRRTQANRNVPLDLAQRNWCWERGRHSSC